MEHHDQQARRAADDPDTQADRAWAQQMRARGLTQAAHTALDALAPLGPLGAQLLYVAQPAFGLFGAARTAGSLARALEEPGGVERLHRLLDDC